jgi:hypothetical protein
MCLDCSVSQASHALVGERRGHKAWAWSVLWARAGVEALSGLGASSLGAGPEEVDVRGVLSL